MEERKIGRPMFTNRELVSLSVPIVIESVLAIITGMADSTMVSSAGEAAVSGISLVDQLFIVLAVLFSSVASGGVVVTAQYIGNQDFQKAKSSARQLLYGSTAIALLLSLGAIGLIPQILHLVYGELEPAVMENATAYFLPVIPGIITRTSGITEPACIKCL